MRVKLFSGTVVKIIRCHHCMTEDCVGKIGVIEKVVLSNRIFRVKIDKVFWLFGARDLEKISTYDLLNWR